MTSPQTSADLIEQLTDSLADQVIAKLGPKPIAYLDEQRLKPEENPLLTVREAGQRLGLGETKVRELVELGALHRAPGLLEIRIRQSVVDAYGTAR